MSSNVFDNRSFDNNASGRIFPKRYKQFAGKCHDSYLSEPAAVLHDAIVKPTGE